MAELLARLSARSPRALLGLALLVVIGLGLYATGVPERLALGGGQLAGSESGETDAALAAELGYSPEAAFVVVLRSSEPVTIASRAVTVRAVRSQIELIDGVGAAVEARGAPRQAAIAAIAVHLEPGVSAETVETVGDRLAGLDSGQFEPLVGGSVPTEQGARRAALDQAPKLLALVAPLLLLLLGGALGWRPALGVLLGAAAAAIAALSAVGLLAELFDIQAIAVIAATLLAALLSIQAATTLLYRYRDESATLGGNAEALEYSLHIAVKGAAIGMLSVALVAGGLLMIPIDFVRSIGAGTLIAALLGGPVGLLTGAAVISLRLREEVGEALPLMADDAPVESGPLAFRGLLALGRRRARGLLALLPVLLAVAVALPLLDSEAIGLAAAELPDDETAAEAGAELAGSYGAGAVGPLLVLTDGPAEAPTVTIYRSAVADQQGIAAVGRAATVDGSAAFEAVVDARPQSLAGQQAARELRALHSPSPAQVGGQPAALADSAARVGDDLPLIGLLILAAAALLWSLLFRSAYGAALALTSAFAPLAGVAAMVAVFGEGRFSDLLDYAPSGAPHLQAYVIVASVLLAIGLSRGAQFATALREERTLGGGAAGSLARSGTLTLLPAGIATLAGVVLAGAWLGADLLPAKEIAVGISVGLLADLLVVRTLLAPAVARLTL